ncbi:MAG: hypothetical protein M1820_003479 [Bogoriella megaspora]|nr:MAG: hypothetical protein M1820_003479 [Bogoriella megaspora]
MDVKIFDVPILECVTCMDMVKAIDTVQLECEPDRHIYCHTCLVELFVKATKDESIYPPSCCGKDIPLETVQPFLEPAQTEDFLNKSVEFRTTKRTYCHDRLCSTFIPQPEIEDNIGTCLECDSDTCAVCKHAAHEGEDCRKDDTDRDLLYMSQREGWKRCPRCERVIGLRVGCFHIT